MDLSYAFHLFVSSGSSICETLAPLAHFKKAQQILLDIIIDVILRKLFTYYNVLISFSARIMKGPAPLNLEVPKHEYLDEGTVIIGKED